MTNDSTDHTNSKVQIVATIGPACKDKETLREMIGHNMDVARLNFSWGTHAEHASFIQHVREIAQEVGRRIPIILDLSGPRIQEITGHRFDTATDGIITTKDLEDLKFGIEQKVDYFALSFVGGEDDVLKLRAEMEKLGATVPVVSKIERQIALDNIDEIIKISDAIMVARGDLGNEIPLEQIPFIERDIIAKCKTAGKPVIVATQMMLSMMSNKEPTRAEITDVAFAVISGADAVMLSEESASGKYPLETVIMMERGIREAEKHSNGVQINSL